MRKLILSLSALACLFLANCSSTSLSAYQKFNQNEAYPKTLEEFRNEAVLAKANQSNTSLVIDLSDQRLQMLVGGQVALDTPCCTGRAGKRTPTGTFRIKEKIADKRSSIFGKLFRNGKQVYGGDRRKYKKPYDRFVGSSLPNWMRLTWDGIGMHYSKNVKRYPASAGCIRMTRSGVRTVYSKVKRGTTVVVKN